MADRTFPEWFYYGMLRSMKWPRKVGLRRREVVEAALADVTGKQLMDLGRSIGAGDARLGASLIADVFRPQWTPEKAEELAAMFEKQHSDGWLPLVSIENEVPWEFMTHEQMRSQVAVNFAAEIWHGMCHAGEVTQQFDATLRGGRERARVAATHGLAVDPERIPESAADQFRAAVATVRQFEQEIGILPDPPGVLIALSTSRSVRTKRSPGEAPGEDARRLVEAYRRLWREVRDGFIDRGEAVIPGIVCYQLLVQILCAARLRADLSGRFVDMVGFDIDADTAGLLRDEFLGRRSEPLIPAFTRCYERRRAEVVKGGTTEGESLEVEAAYQTTALYLMVQRRHTDFADDFVRASPEGNTSKMAAFVTSPVADSICESLFPARPEERSIPTPDIGAVPFDQFTNYCRVARAELGDIIGREVDGTTARHGRVMLCAKIVFQLLGVAERMPHFAPAMVSTVLPQHPNEQQVDFIARAALCEGVPDIPNRTQAGLRFHYEETEQLIETEGMLKLDIAEVYSYLYTLCQYLSVQANRPDFARALIAQTESPEPAQWLHKHDFDYAEVASRLLARPL